MKIQYIKLTIASLLLLVAVNLTAQEETIKVPLSDPSKPGKLKLVINSGNITVKGYSGKEVIVKATRREGRKHWRKDKGGDKKGLKRIAVNGLEFRAEEDDNYVVVDTRYYQAIDFEVQVPKNFSLKLRTVNNGNIVVENVNGAMDVSNTNGSITLTDVSGSVSADALNKDIKVTFVKVTPNAPMAFSSFNGDIDITFPKDIKAKVKVKSERGEIYTDFDINAKPSDSKIAVRNKSGKGKTYQVKVEKWVVGTINGGGAEILFKNYNGDVIIRSK
ncbi:DUF4097 family beta strand repeat-containing protein [Pseudotenacibaculum sp. MALMAid0570]|uniref:DUF4097 family beta strand repeat-containing protein n=1 Tax=Pseudotenacibaculum sp. MALMAid0570 TaxID=3143938 RepID=UPI0032E010FD